MLKMGIAGTLIVSLLMGGGTGCTQNEAVVKEKEQVQENTEIDEKIEEHIMFQTNPQKDGVKFTIKRNELLDTYIIACGLYTKHMIDNNFYNGYGIGRMADSYFQKYRDHEFFQDFEVYLKSGDVDPKRIKDILNHEDNNFTRKLKKFYKDANGAEFFESVEKDFEQIDEALKEHMREIKSVELIKEMERTLNMKEELHGDFGTEYESVVSIFRRFTTDEYISIRDNKDKLITFDSDGWLCRYREKSDISRLFRKQIRGIIHRYLSDEVERQLEDIDIGEEPLRLTLNKNYRNLPLSDQISEYLTKVVKMRVYGEVFHSYDSTQFEIDKTEKSDRFEKFGRVYKLIEKHIDGGKKSMQVFINEAINTLIQDAKAQMKNRWEHENLTLEHAKDIIWKLEGENDIFMNEGGRILGKKNYYDIYGYYTYSSWNGFTTVDDAMKELQDYCTRPALEYLMKKDVCDIFNGKVGYAGTNEMWGTINKEFSKIRFIVDEKDYKEVEVELFIDGYYREEDESKWGSTVVYTFKFIDNRWKVVCVDGYDNADHKYSFDNKTYIGDFSNITASSELIGENNDYSPELVDDSQSNTAWVEGVPGHGIGEWILFQNENEMDITGMEIANGYFKSPEALKNNSRVRKIGVAFDDGQSRVFELEDLEYDSKYYSWPRSFQFQTLDFGEVIKTKSIKVTILEVYKGDKYEDACISEIKFIEEKNNDQNNE